MLSATKGIRPNGTINIGNRKFYLHGVMNRCTCYYGCKRCGMAMHELMLLDGYTVCEGTTKKGLPCKNWSEDNSNTCHLH